MKITVVGAGVIGCAIAHELVSRGARVHVVDPRGAGQGATRASAGILAPYLEGHRPSLLRLGLSGLALYDGFIARLRQETSVPIEYDRGGSLQVALDDVDVAELSALARRLGDAGESHALLDAGEARRLEPALSARVAAALLVPRHGYVQAVALLEGLVEASRARGATFATTRALGVSSTGSAVTVMTPDGPLEGDAVIIAAGSWSSDILRGAAQEGRAPISTVEPPFVRPIRGQLVHLEASSRAAAHVLWGRRCYLVPWSEGSVLVGATVEDVGFDERSTVAGVQGLLDSAIEILPTVRSAALREVRVGLRPETRDELPVIGPSSTMRNVFYATGHYRSGVMLAPLTAALVADLVIGGCGRPELELTRPDRFGL